MKDKELLLLFIEKHDTLYMGELYSRYIHLVYGVCLNHLKNVDKAKDAVINIYEKLQHEIHKHSIDNFKSWLYVVSKNYCLMELRRNKSEFLVSSEETIEYFMENEQEMHPIDEEKNSERTEEALADCIKRLKTEQKDCILLFYYENKCYREIATVLKAEEKKVKSFIQNGKRNIKICMERKNEQQ